MKKRPVVYLPSAERDLVESFEYMLKDSPVHAAAWLERVDKTLGRLAEFPLSGNLVRDERLAAQGYRVVVVGEHLAFYIVGPKRVEIRRVIHGRRRYAFLIP